MITITVLSCLQIAALIYLGAASIRMNRLQTLSKNFDWVLQNTEFIKKHGEPVYWPLITMGIMLFGVVLASTISGSTVFFIYSKYIALFSAVTILFTSYYLIDKKVLIAIPLKKERTATFVKRTLDYYVHPGWLLGAKIGTLTTIIAAIISFVISKITFATFVVDLSCAVFCFGLIWLGIYLALKEKIPHVNDISRITTIDLGENYRKFSLGLQIGMIYFFTCFILFLIGIQWFGYVIALSPYILKIYAFFGETALPFKPIFDLVQWENISTIVSIMFFIVIVNCKPFKNIVSIRIKPQIR